jgi:hypothetical protein
MNIAISRQQKLRSAAMAAPPIYPRFAASRVTEGLADTPAVLIHGPRQCGKTTLAQLIGEKREYRYVTFDDATVAAAARADPVGFVDRLPERVILSYTDYVNRTVWRT